MADRQMKQNILRLLLIFTFLMIFNPIFSFRDYFTNFAGVRVGVNQNYLDLSGEKNNESYEMYGAGFGSSFLFFYDFKYGSLFFDISAGIMNTQPRVDKRENNSVVVENVIFISNYFITSFLLKFPMVKGLYFGVGASSYIPMKSPDEIITPKPDAYLDAELGYLYIWNEKIIITLSAKGSFNVSNQNFIAIDNIDKAFNYNTQILLGVGYRLEQ